MPNSRNPETKRPDPIGACLSIAGMALLLWGIIDAPDRSWTSPLILGAIAAAIAVLTLFALWERHSSHPMLDVTFFRSRRFSAAMGTMGLVMFALMGGLFLLTQYLQFSLGYTAFETGLRIAPIAAVLLVVAPLSSVLDHIVGTKPVVFAGMVFITLGFGLLARVTVHDTYMDVLPAFLSIGLGTGLAFAPCTESVMGSLPVDQAGVGTATNGDVVADRWCARGRGSRQPPQHPLPEPADSGARPLQDAGVDLAPHHGLARRSSRRQPEDRRGARPRTGRLRTPVVHKRARPCGDSRSGRGRHGRTRRAGRAPEPQRPTSTRPESCNSACRSIGTALRPGTPSEPSS